MNLIESTPTQNKYDEDNMFDTPIANKLSEFSINSR